MTAHADVVTSIAAVARSEWNALCGDDLYSSHEWLSGVEEDVRADTRYVLVRSGGRLVAAMPLYRVREEPNAFYRPHVHFGLPEARPPWWLAGSGRGYRNPLLVADDAPETRAALLAAVAEECGAPAWLLFLTEAAFTALDGEDGISRAVPCLAAESVLSLPGHDFGDYLAGLSPTRRRTVGKEVRRFQRADLTLAEEPPEENVELVAGLVHRLNRKHGRESDVAAHAAALRAQLRHLGDRARLFTCRLGDRVVGVTVGYVWHDLLYLWFAGFDYAAKPGAYEYFNLSIYEPVRFCYRTRLRGVHLGVGAHHAKAARGAQVRPLFAAVYDPRAHAGPDADGHRQMAWAYWRAQARRVPHAFTSPGWAGVLSEAAR